MEMSLMFSGYTLQHLLFYSINTLVPLFVVVSMFAQCCKKKNNLEGADTSKGTGMGTPGSAVGMSLGPAMAEYEDKTQPSSKKKIPAAGDVKESEKKADNAKDKKESSKGASKKETSKKEASKKTEVKKNGSKKEEVEKKEEEKKEEEKKDDKPKEKKASEKDKSKADAAKDEKKDDEKKEKE